MVLVIVLMVNPVMEPKVMLLLSAPNDDNETLDGISSTCTPSYVDSPCPVQSKDML